MPVGGGGGVADELLRELLLPASDVEELRVSRRLGSGGFATVHRASWKGRPVALKVLLAQHAKGSGAFVRMFLREAQYLRSCSHP